MPTHTTAHFRKAEKDVLIMGEVLIMSVFIVTGRYYVITNVLVFDTIIDSGIFGEISFSAVNTHFRLNPKTGVLSLAKILDREIQSSFSFTVTAIDGAGLSESVLIDIQITDVNDNAPEILTRNIFGTAKEGINFKISTSEKYLYQEFRRLKYRCRFVCMTKILAKISFWLWKQMNPKFSTSLKFRISNGKLTSRSRFC